MTQKLLAFPILFMVAMIVLTLCSHPDTRAGSHRIQVVTSIPLLKNLAERIGGNAATVDTIIKNGNCCHEYEPGAGDMKRVASCAIFIKAGLGFDSWADKLASAGGTGLKVVNLSKGVGKIKDDIQHGVINPHYWWNPSNVHLMAKNIEAGLSTALPAKKAYFAANREAFDRELDKTSLQLKSQVAKLKNKNIVSYAAAFSYLYGYFGFHNLITVQSVCEELEISPKRLAEAVATAKAHGVKAVVGEAVEPKDPVALAQETGAKLVLLWPTTNSSNDYLKTLSDNVGRMVTALK